MQQSVRRWSREAARCVQRAGMKELCADTRGSRDIVIALVDGAPDLSHPALAGTSIEVVSNGRARSPAASAHATFITSMLVGRHPAVLGLCPECRLVVIAAVDEWLLSPATPPERAARVLASAIDECRYRGAHLVQVSLELGLGTTVAAQMVRQAIASLTKSGAVVVMAAGHATLRRPNDLLWAPGVIPVGAADEDGIVPWDERCGSQFALRGIAAPGNQVPGAVPHDGFGLQSGSSYAASFVTAALALQMARTSALSPWDTAGQLMVRRQVPRSTVRVPQLDAGSMFPNTTPREGAFNAQCASA